VYSGGFRILAAGGFCGLSLASFAVASPPPSGARPQLAANDSARAVSVADTAFSRMHASAARLDLRLPGYSPPAINGGAASGFATTAFPSRTDSGTDDRYEQRTLGVGNVNFRTMSQAQILVLRARREGLPVARLLESKSALLSIGLNQRGKPGLWLTQKVR
jgi:hypothetical protein